MGEIAVHPEPIPLTVDEVGQTSAALWEKHKCEQQTVCGLREVEDKRLKYEQSVMEYTLQFKGGKQYLCR